MVDKKIVVAPVGDFIDEIFVGIREFPTERVILLTPPSQEESARKAKEDLDRFKIPTQIWNLPVTDTKAEMWEEIFKAISEIRGIEGADNLIIHVSTGDRETRCAATSAGSSTESKHSQ